MKPPSTPSKEHPRELDLVLIGATGYTGRLVAEHLAARRPSLRLGLAGRSQEKLERVRAGLGESQAALPLLIHDSLDATSMTALARRARVVCSTVGPYARWGSPLVAACAAEGTSYCDLTGEPDWVRAMIDAHQSRAVETGARIVPSCGFDSIPSDLGVWLLGEHFEGLGKTLASALLRVTSMRGGFSGGTIASGLAIAERMSDPSVRQILGNPYALCPDGEREGPDRDRLGVGRDPATGHWTAPFIMASANTRVVRRSNALLGYPWGRGFHYDEVVDLGAGPSGFVSAYAIGGGMAAFAALAASAPTRGLLARFLPAQGEGPKPEERERGRFRIAIDGTATDGTKACVQIAADRDPGYGGTAILLGESALCLAEDALPARAGFLTPCAAMGKPLLARLRAEGIRFEIA